MKYLTGPDGLPIEQVDGSGTVLYYLQDQLGSTRGLVDGSGSIVGSFTYDPYGNLKSSSGTSTTPFQYAGQYTDAESGLQYLRTRYYDSATAEFLSADLAKNQTGEPYSYTAGSPLNMTDPWGLCKGGVPLVPCPVSDWLGQVGSWIHGNHPSPPGTITPTPADTPTPPQAGAIPPTPSPTPRPTASATPTPCPWATSTPLPLPSATFDYTKAYPTPTIPWPHVRAAPAPAIGPVPTAPTAQQDRERICGDQTYQDTPPEDAEYEVQMSRPALIVSSAGTAIGFFDWWLCIH